MSRVKVTGVICVLATSTALAERNAGTYTLDQKGSADIAVDGVKLPRCEPEELAPAKLVIQYSGPETPIVLVNGEKWHREGLTTDPDGRESSTAMRIASKPQSDPDVEVAVMFRRDQSRASGGMHVLRMDPSSGKGRCGIGYHFAGSFRPR